MKAMSSLPALALLSCENFSLVLVEDNETVGYSSLGQKIIQSLK